MKEESDYPYELDILTESSPFEEDIISESDAEFSTTTCWKFKSLTEMRQWSSAGSKGFILTVCCMCEDDNTHAVLFSHCVVRV